MALRAEDGSCCQATEAAWKNVSEETCIVDGKTLSKLLGSSVEGHISGHVERTATRLCCLCATVSDLTLTVIMLGQLGGGLLTTLSCCASKRGVKYSQWAYCRY